MPKLKATEPKKDPVKALILERKLALKLTDDELSQLVGVCRQTLSVLMNHKHTDEWSLGKIKKVCKALNVTVEELRYAVQYR